MKYTNVLNYKHIFLESVMKFNLNKHTVIIVMLYLFLDDNYYLLYYYFL